MKRTAWLVSVSVLLVLLLTGATVFANAPYRPASKSGPAAAGNGMKPVGAAEYATDHILVQFKSGSLPTKLGLRPQTTSSNVATGMASVDAISRQLGVVAIGRPFMEPVNSGEAHYLGLDRWYSMQLPDGADITAAVAAYAADPNVEHASPDWKAELAVVPTDPAYPQHWGHNNTAQLPGLDWGGTYDHTLATTVGTVGFDTNAQPGWDGTAGFGSSSVVIAIIDTGCNLAHPDLAFVTGWDFGDNDSNPEDNSSGGGHGTCCAGVAAA